MMSGPASVDPVVSVEWLKDQISGNCPTLVILESTWLPDHHSSQEAFVREHIPGALFFDLNSGIKPRPTCARNLPEIAEFESYVRELGVNADSHVVLYERAKIACATKAWWLFKVFGHENVSVLDGGLTEWKVKGGNLVSGEGKPNKTGNFSAKLRRELFADYDEMVDILKTKKMAVIDTREAVHFKGNDPEPSPRIVKALQDMKMPVPDSIHKGHMTGAVHIFREDVLNAETLRFLSKPQLTKLFADAGVDIQKPFVTTCYIGHTATLINMAAVICGNHNTRLYYGSWTEFGQLAPKELIAN